jgi:hypothetical protein
MAVACLRLESQERWQEGEHNGMERTTDGGMGIEYLMDNTYGPVYEIVGFADLASGDRSRFVGAFTDFFLVKGAVPGSLEPGSWLGVYADRKGEYPDLMLELSPEGRLLVCDMDVHKAGLLAHLQKFLRVFPRKEVIPQLTLKLQPNTGDGSVTEGIDP